MPTIGSITKTIRFSPSDLEKIELTMKKEDTSFNNAVHLLINQTGVPAKKDDLSDLSEMASLMCVTTEKLLSDIKDLVENGDLYYMGGRLINPKYEEFERVCEKRNVKVEHIITKAIREIENGK